MVDDKGDRRSLKRSSRDEQDMSQRTTGTSKRFFAYKSGSKGRNQGSPRLSQGQQKNPKIWRREKWSLEAQQAHESQVDPPTYPHDDPDTQLNSPLTALTDDLLKREKFRWSEEYFPEEETPLQVTPTGAIETKETSPATCCLPFPEDTSMEDDTSSVNVAVADEFAGYSANEAVFKGGRREYSGAPMLDQPDTTASPEQVQALSSISVPQERSAHTEMHNYTTASPKQEKKDRAETPSFRTLEGMTKSIRMNSAPLSRPIPIMQDNTSLQDAGRFTLRYKLPFRDVYQGSSKSNQKYLSKGLAIQQSIGNMGTKNMIIHSSPGADPHYPYSRNRADYRSEPVRSPPLVHTGSPPEYVLGAFNRFSASIAAATYQSPIHGWPSLMNAFNTMTRGRYSQQYLQRLVGIAQSNAEAFPLCREMSMNGNKAMMETQHDVVKSGLSNILRSGRRIERPMALPHSHEASASRRKTTCRRAGYPTESSERLGLNAILQVMQQEASCTLSYGACLISENLILLMCAVQDCPIESKNTDPSLSFREDSVNSDQTRGLKLQVAELLFEATVELNQKEDLMNFLVISRDMMSRYWDELARSKRVVGFTGWYEMEEGNAGPTKDKAQLRKPQSADDVEMVDGSNEDLDMDRGEEDEVSGGAAVIQMHDGLEQITINPAKAIIERGCGVRGLGCGGKEERSQPSASESSQPSDEEANESGPVQQVSFVDANYLPWTHWHCCHPSSSGSVERCSHKNRRSWKICRRAGCTHPILCDLFQVFH